MIDESTAHIIGGGIGGTVAAIVTSPLEVVKVRFQSSDGAILLNRGSTHFPRTPSGWKERIAIFSRRRLKWLAAATDIARIEGKSALYKGLVPTIFGVLPSRATYFYAYHSGQEFFGKYFPNNSSCVYLCSAILGSLTASTLTSPIWYIKTRLQLDSGTGTKSLTLLKVIRSTYEKNGIRGFYRGITASYIGSLETAINYVTYENLKAHLLSWDRNRKRNLRENQAKQLMERIECLQDKRQYLINRELDLVRLKRREELRKHWWWPFSVKSNHIMRNEAITELDDILIAMEKQLQILLLCENRLTSLDQPEDLKGSAGGSKLQGFTDMLFIGLASCCAKGVAITVAYPHEVVRTRLREPGGRYKGFFNTLFLIGRKEGIHGLYRGLVTHYIRQVPNSGIMMGTYEGVIFALQYWDLMRVNGNHCANGDKKPRP